MKVILGSKIQSLILAAALSIGSGFVSPVSARQHSYLVDSNSKGLTDLGTLGGDSVAFGINDAGQVVGYFTTAAGYDHAFITGPNGAGMTDLGTLGGKIAFGINDAGQVVGQSVVRHAFITGPNGVGMTDLGTLGGLDYSGASGINDAGQVVGESFTGRGAESRAFISPNGRFMTDLGTLGGDYSYAYGINDAGQVVGGSFTAQVVGGSFTVAGAEHAFITGPNGVGMTDLGTLGGGDSYASGINDAGQVVGDSTTATGDLHAFITGPNGAGMTDLNSLVGQSGGVVLTEAVGINNHGQVIALGIPTPIPEPETYAMLLAGLGLLGFIARRCKTV